MRCSEAREASVGRVAPGTPQDAETAEHMRGCPACTLWWERARRVHEALSGLRLPDPPEQLAELTGEGIAEGLKETARPKGVE